MSETIKARYAVVNTHATTEVASYLHPNYLVMGKHTAPGGNKVVVIGGHDRYGWTLTGYYIPRLGSALLHCKEVAAESVVKWGFIQLPDLEVDS